MSLPALSPPTPLTPGHQLAAFDCGNEVLTDWLRRRALANQVSHASRTFVVCHGDEEVVGYYSLASGAIARQSAPGAVRRNMPEPIPVIVLGRLAVDVRYQGAGLGGVLLRDAMLRILTVSREVAVKALIVHAISDDARKFYRRYDFIESPTDPMTLLLPLATIATALEPGPNN